MSILEKETVFKVIETSMDFLEYALTALPEIIIDYIEQLVLVLLKLMQSKK